MKKIALLALFTAAAGFAVASNACNGDSSQADGGPDTGVADTGNDVAQGDGGTPLPTLKTQIDRMGRPAINTALNHVFDPTCTPTTCAPKDTYNADKNVAGWGAAYAGQFAGNLAIFDALDTLNATGDGCGNQAAYSPTTHYAGLAALTADDQLYVDTSKTTCTTYLAVELQATGIIPNQDCGGRKMTYDVMNSTYSVVAGLTDAGTPQTPVTDGPTVAIGSKTNGTTFPYLAPPQ